MADPLVLLHQDTIAAGLTAKSGDVKANFNQLITRSNLHETRITSAEASITSYGTRITANEVQIAANETDIATNETDIATNTAGIATNVTNIATNAADIVTNAADIATNAADIAAIDVLKLNVLNDETTTGATTFLMSALVSYSMVVYTGDPGASTTLTLPAATSASEGKKLYIGNARPDDVTIAAGTNTIFNDDITLAGNVAGQGTGGIFVVIKTSAAAYKWICCGSYTST